MDEQDRVQWWTLILAVLNLRILGPQHFGSKYLLEVLAHHY